MAVRSVVIPWAKSKRDDALLYVLTSKGIGFKVDKSGFTVKTSLSAAECVQELSEAVDRRLAALANRTARRKRRSGYLGRLASEGPAPK